MEDGVLLFRLHDALGGEHLADRNAIERPAMRGCHRADLVFRLGERYVKDWLTAARALHQELKCERRLARARHPLDQIQAAAYEASCQDVVQPFDTGLDSWRVHRGFQPMKRKVYCGDLVRPRKTASAARHRIATEERL